MRVLVVAGEPSGDRTLASVVARLAAHGPVEVTGLGGDALEATGARLLAHVRDLAAMGLFEVVARAPAIASALARLLAHARRRDGERPDVALLASWSSANARLGRRLRALGIPVVWIAPPEIWAWGAGRLRGLAQCADRFVVTLPFEETIWRGAGADARYLGHPVLELPRRARADARRALGLRADATALAILPGSRPGEVRRLLGPMLEAAARLARLPRLRGGPAEAPIEARILAAPSLPASVARALAEAATSAGLARVEVAAERGAIEHLAAFDVALVASGTASLECALADVPPVVAYAMHPLTLAIARVVVRTDRIALPNVVLVRAGAPPAFDELVAARPDPATLAEALTRTLADPRAHAACARVRSELARGLEGEPPFSERVARLVRELAPRV
jgi:lipid-A-disaccharide synthase